MEKYKYVLCTEKKQSNLISFIRKYWDKNHIFIKNKKLFNWQFKNSITKKYNFILCEDKNNKIIGILGFIPINQFSKKIKFKTAVWLSFWKNINENKFPGIGLGMIEYLKKKIGIETILNIGLNDRVIPLFKYLKYKTGKLQHYVILNSKVKKFFILKHKNNFKKKIIFKRENFNLFKISKKNLNYNKGIFGTGLFTFFPKKNIEFLIKRYLAHPVYNYNIYILKKGEIYCCALLIIRKIKFKNSNVLRLVDYQGKEKYLKKIYNPLQELLSSEKSEYIDFYQHGISKNTFRNSGFIDVEKTKIIVPNYFEPFIKKNINLNFAYKSSIKNRKIYFFKGDGDQDRPN